MQIRHFHRSWLDFKHSCNTPTTISKVHNLSATKIAVKIAGIVLSSREKKIPMTIKPSMAIAPKTIPTIKATLWRLMEPKRSTESMIKSMAKMIAAAMKSAQKIAPRSWQGWKWKAPLNIMKRYYNTLLSNYILTLWSWSSSNIPRKTSVVMSKRLSKTMLAILKIFAALKLSMQHANWRNSAISLLLTSSSICFLFYWRVGDETRRHPIPRIEQKNV